MYKALWEICFIIAEFFIFFRLTVTTDPAARIQTSVTCYGARPAKALIRNATRSIPTEQDTATADTTERTKRFSSVPTSKLNQKRNEKPPTTLCNHQFLCRNVKCGMLHCKHLNERLEFGMESASILSHTFINFKGNVIACRTAIVDLGLNEIDPGLVPDGSKCGINKVRPITL